MTLVEVVLFIVIVSVALAGVLSVFNMATQHSADPLVRKQALTVAEHMMHEILTKAYDDPGGLCTPTTMPSCRANTPADRANYNDVADYAGWDQTGVRDVAGTPVPGLELYRVTVTVENAALHNVAAARRIVVAVTGGNETITLTGWRTGYE